MRGLSLPGPVSPSENRSVQGDHLHSNTQFWPWTEVSPVAKPPCKSLGRRREKYFCNRNSRPVAKPPCKSLGRRIAPGRMDWSRTDFWLAVGTGKNRSSTTTSPCTPYPLPSELQGDRVGKDYLLQNLHLDMRTGLSNCQPHTVLEEAQNDVHEHMLFPMSLQGVSKTSS